MIQIFKYTPTRKVSMNAVVDAKTATITGVQKVAVDPDYPGDKLRVSIGDPGRPTHFMLIDRKMVNAMHAFFNKKD